MADDVAPNQNAESDQPSAVTQNTDVMIPKQRFDEVIQERNEFRKKITEFERTLQQQAETQKQAEEERLAKQAEWQTLAEQRAKELEEYKPFKQRWDGLVEQTAERNKARIDAVPETMRTLIPDYDDPMKLSAWLDANEATITQTKSAPKLDGGAGNGSRSGSQPLSEAEIREKAAVYGVSPAAMRQVLGIQ